MSGLFPSVKGLWTVAVAAVLAAPLALPSGAAPRDRLPDLAALPSNVIYAGGPQDVYTDGDGNVIYGCQPTEVARDSPTPLRCLRFETRSANLGDGPLELHFHADQIATTRGVTQWIYAGAKTHREVAAGTYEYDPAHAHFHFLDFAVAALWRSDARGRRLDPAPLRKGRKTGFCLEDVYPYRTAPTAAYTGRQSCYPTQVEGTGLSQVNGITEGWADVYDVSLPHQYIEISGVPDGYYLLQLTIDPLHKLREQTTRDNVVWQRIRLCAAGADIVGRTHLCG